MNTKHTPGPWSVARYSRGANAVNVTGPCDLPRPRFGPVASTLANLAGPLDAEALGEMKANARLIAAAPEMLEMLTYCHEWLQGSEPHRAAAVGELIAKAAGESA